MDTLGKRLTWAREQKALTQEGLARLSGVSQGTIGNLEAGIRQTARKIVDIAKAVGVDPDWLANGQGSPEFKLTVKAPATIDPTVDDLPFIEEAGDLRGSRQVRVEDDPDTVTVPRVKLRLRAGVSQYDTEPDMNGDGYVDLPRSVLIDLQLDPANLVALPVRGTSMEPMMFEDDLIVIDKSDRKPINRELYAINFDGEALVKQLLYRGGQWYMHSLNPDFGPVNVRSGQCSIVGRVVIQPTRVLTGRL